MTTTISRRAAAAVALAGLALCADVALAQTYRTTRPVRGVYLRPPASLTGTSGLEGNLANMANAKATDLFLETLYWGVSTGKPGVFNARFGYDYLQEAIVRSARYGVRVHAWCESAYLQFGSTGAYNFTVNAPGASEGNPEWKAISATTMAGGGDGTSGQIFGNLAHPGLQAKLRNYFAELSTYPGIWGVMTDYHRYALDDNTGDANPAPWSFDTWSRNAFMAIYGAANDPLLKAITTSGSTGTQYTNFINWRKAGTTEAARQMKLGIDGEDASVEFSAAMFANPEAAKCQDWKAWATNGYIDWLCPMVYNSSTGGITSDLNTVKANAAGRRVIASLYTDSTSGHPTMSQQLTACNSATGTTGVGIQDWIFFSGPTFTVVANQTTLANFVTATATKQRGDFNNDGYIDSTDWQMFTAVYSGTPVSSGGANARYNYNADGFVNETDWTLFKAEFFRWHFGESRKIGIKSLTALTQCWGGTPAIAGIKHLFDLNGDGTVNQPDLDLTMLQRSCPGDLNDDGSVDDADFVLFADAYNVLLCSPGPSLCLADQNVDGSVDDTDFVAFADGYNTLVCP